MATTTLSQNPQIVTIPANTDEHQIDFNNILKGPNGDAAIEWISGTSFQINSNGAAIDSAVGALNSSQTKVIVPIERGTNMRMKGGAGSETFLIAIWNK